MEEMARRGHVMAVDVSTAPVSETSKVTSRLENIEFPAFVEKRSFRWQRIESSQAKHVEFRECDFSQASLNRCYFHRAVFINCNFTGVLFVDCNLRGAKFVGCKLEYAQFKNTLVDPAPMLSNLPAWENVRRELLRGLRKNAESVGEMEDVRVYFRAEMDASAEHWRSAFRQVTGYYKEHYGGLAKRANALVCLMRLKVSKHFWGYGESPFRLVLSALIWVTLLAIAQWIATGGGAGRPSLWIDMLLVFLGAPSPLATSMSPTLLALTYFSRYVFLGLLASVAVRRYTLR
jgi:hypothetical protein